MNALEIIEQVRAHDADLALDNDRLVVRGRGERLPPDLQEQLRQHKTELMVALGGSMEVAIAEVLAEIRPHLPASLREVPDAKLLILVNWSILHAWGAKVRSIPT